MATDVLGKRQPLEVVEHQIRPGLVGAGMAEVAEAGQGRMVQLLQPVQFAKQHLHRPVKAVLTQALDHHLFAAVAFPAQEGHTKGASTEDRLGLIAGQRKRFPRFGAEQPSRAARASGQSRRSRAAR